MRLYHCLLGSVSVVFTIYHAMAMALLKFSSCSYWQRLSKALLRLAPNRPCMTLICVVSDACTSQGCSLVVSLLLGNLPPPPAVRFSLAIRKPLGFQIQYAGTKIWNLFPFVLFPANISRIQQTLAENGDCELESMVAKFFAHNC